MSLTAPEPFSVEPHTDFSRAEARTSMKAALEQVGRQLGSTFPLVIDNQPVSTPELLDSLNPSHKRQVVGRCGKATAEHARSAIGAARRAFPAWRDTDPSRRAR